MLKESRKNKNGNIMNKIKRGEQNTLQYKNLLFNLLYLCHVWQFNIKVKVMLSITSRENKILRGYFVISRTVGNLYYFLCKK